MDDKKKLEVAYAIAKDIKAVINDKTKLNDAIDILEIVGKLLVPGSHVELRFERL